MKTDLKEELEIPEAIKVEIEKGMFIVKGPKGEIQKRMHNPRVTSRIIGNRIVLESKRATQKEKKLIKAYAAHLKNMFKGIRDGCLYKLKVCSGHFPMTVAVKGDMFEIKNFIGETIPRTLKIPSGVSVKVDGQFITVEGIDKGQTSQTAAQIEKLTRRPGFDKRIFQDGIFLIEKDGNPAK
jgi:large subunit ribosomal protein L6